MITEIELLVKLGANINQKNYEGATALIVAAQEGLMDVVNKLISLGADVNLQTKKGATAFYCAAHCGHSGIIHELAKHGANPTITMHNGWSPIHIATAKGHRSIIEELVLTYNLDINTLDNKGICSAYFLAEFGHTHLIDDFFKFGVDFTKACCSQGHTPVHIAAQFGHLDTLIEFTQYNVSLDIPNIKDGNVTPLYMAARFGYLDVVDYLLYTARVPIRPYQTNADYLRRVFNEKKHQERIETVIQQKLEIGESEGNLNIFPKEAAFIAGHNNVLVSFDNFYEKENSELSIKLGL